jgi:nucleoside-diphosphate-sugar epimerase
MEVMEPGKHNNVLVTGARGFVGRSVAKLLRRHSYTVISLDKSSAGTDSTEVVCDITDRAALRDVFQREHPEAIIHLAAILPTAAQREPLPATQVNIQGSVNLLELATEFSVRRFILGSSMSVYGTWPADESVSETSRAAPEDLYAAAKLYVERLGEAYRVKHGLEFVSLRIGRVVGPGARSATSAWRSEIFERLGDADAAEINLPYSDSERVLLVHVEDVAQIVLKLLQAPQLAHPLYNAACESVIVGELKSTIQRLNPKIKVSLGGRAVEGNPRRVDWSRFREEFGFEMLPISEQLKQAAAVSHSRRQPSA